MSHRATNWAIQQRGLAPATKIVLWYLADRHNPDFGCFPSQAQLAADCEMARGTLNRHLDELERRGLIRREPRIDPVTKRQKTTRYILAFEPDFAGGGGRAESAATCPETGHGTGTEAERRPQPCPETGHGSEASRVSVSGGAVSHGCETPITGKGTSKREEENAGTRDRDRRREADCSGGDASGAVVGAENRRGAAGELVIRICEALGRPELAATRWWRIEAEFGRRIAAWRQLGLSDDQIVEVARRFGREMPEAPQGPKALDAAMVRAARSGGRPAVPVEARDVVELLGHALAEGRFVPASAVTPRIAREMLARGLVTQEQLRARGIAA